LQRLRNGFAHGSVVELNDARAKTLRAELRAVGAVRTSALRALEHQQPVDSLIVALKVCRTEIRLAGAGLVREHEQARQTLLAKRELEERRARIRASRPPALERRPERSHHRRVDLSKVADVPGCVSRNLRESPAFVVVHNLRVERGQGRVAIRTPRR
jgi:hypothetical protein